MLALESTYSHEDVNEGRRGEHLRAAARGHARDIAYDLDGLAVLRERQEGRYLGLEQLGLRVLLRADVHCARLYQ